MSATFWGLIILAKLCQMNGEVWNSRILGTLAFAIAVRELWLDYRRQRMVRHD